MTASWFHAAAYTAAALLLLTSGGNWTCRLLLSRFKIDEINEIDAKPPAVSGARKTRRSKGARPPEPALGRLIGTLERLLIAAGILLGSWEILVAVIALKTVGRFKDLDERIHAEYFLVGSLFSIAWALFVTGAWLVYDKLVGAGLQSMLG